MRKESYYCDFCGEKIESDNKFKEIKLPWYIKERSFLTNPDYYLRGQGCERCWRPFNQWMNSRKQKEEQLYCQKCGVCYIMCNVKEQMRKELAYYFDTDEHNPITPEIIETWMDKYAFLEKERMIMQWGASDNKNIVKFIRMTKNLRKENDELRKFISEGVNTSLHKYQIFVEHIYNHSDKKVCMEDWVLCKICNKTFKEITDGKKIEEGIKVIKEFLEMLQ